MLDGTEPFFVGGFKMQDADNTVCPAGCWIVSVADVNDKSVIVSVQ